MSKQRDPAEGFFAGFTMGGAIAFLGWSLFDWNDFICVIAMVFGALGGLLWARIAK